MTEGDWIDADVIRIVGVDPPFDTPCWRDHPLHDSRCGRPLQPGIVVHLVRCGLLRPVTLTVLSGCLVAVDERVCLLHVREANRQRAAAGLGSIRVPFVLADRSVVGVTSDADEGRSENGDDGDDAQMPSPALVEATLFSLDTPEHRIIEPWCAWLHGEFDGIEEDMPVWLRTALARAMDNDDGYGSYDSSNDSDSDSDSDE